jgi:hypothetical protein
MPFFQKRASESIGWALLVDKWRKNSVYHETMIYQFFKIKNLYSRLRLKCFGSITAIHFMSNLELYINLSLYKKYECDCMKLSNISLLFLTVWAIVVDTNSLGSSRGKTLRPINRKRKWQLSKLRCQIIVTQEEKLLNYRITSHIKDVG